MSQNRAGCCCGDKCTVGVFCPTDQLFTQTSSAPGFLNSSIEGVFKNIYEQHGKGTVCRIDSEEKLNQVKVAFFGVLAPSNVAGISPPARWVFTPEVTTLPPLSNNGLSGYSTPWWTSNTVYEALASFVSNGGVLVLVGEGHGNVASGAPPVFREVAVNHCNNILQQIVGVGNPVSQFVNASQCVNCFGECTCLAGQCAKLTAVRQIYPDTRFSFYKDNGIYAASGCYAAFFAPGSTNETFMLCDPVSQGGTNSCGSPLSSTLYPIAYTQFGNGYIVIISDTNCLLVSPIIINVFNQGGTSCGCLNCNGGCCPSSSTISSTVNSACNPGGIFTGLNYSNINLPFLWTLVGGCPTCP